MDVTFVQYLGFIVAALILIWAVMVLNKYLTRPDKPGIGSMKNWVELDTRRGQTREDLLPAHTFDDDEEEVELHVRAHQNGHHAENQQPPL